MEPSKFPKKRIEDDPEAMELVRFLLERGYNYEQVGEALYNLDLQESENIGRRPTPKKGRAKK